MDWNAYGVKLVYRYTVGAHIFFEESVLHIRAASFEEASAKAEQYAAQRCGEWVNVQGETVRQALAGISTYFGMYPEDEEDGVLEVFSRIQLGDPALPELLLSECSREDMHPLRQWRDPDFPDEFD